MLEDTQLAGQCQALFINDGNPLAFFEFPVYIVIVLLPLILGKFELNRQREKAMALILPPETYRRLEKRFGEEETKELIKALEETLLITGQKVDEAIKRIENKADGLIAQKKFELKDELTKELATKADILAVKVDIERLEGMIKNVKLELDRKFTIMFLILLFTTIFVNQNALKFMAELLGLIKP